MRVSVDHETLIRELVEDIAEHICDENLISGESVWRVISVFSLAKYVETRGFLNHGSSPPDDISA